MVQPREVEDRRSERFQNERGFALKSPILSEGEIESIETGRRSEQLSIRLCKLLSAEERSRLKGTAVENRDKDLFAIAGIGDIQQRTAVISALSDAEKPAPSLHEAKCRAGLAPHLEPDLEKGVRAGRKSPVRFPLLRKDGHLGAVSTQGRSR